ncbi:MAG: helix-hairpin-helix domain-containing protein, partial [Candidatus Brocadiales bacterium]
MKNAEIASIFERMADVLELKGENPFRISSYRRAARVIGDLTQDIKEIAAEGRLRDIPGIGEGSAEKIEEYLKTGRMSKYEEVMEGVSPETVAMMQIPGLGPKTVAMLNKELGIVGIAQLEEAIRQGRLKGLKGIAEKKIENILKGIELFRTSQQRIALGVAFPVVNHIVEKLREVKGILSIQPAGSLRRMKETIGDIDLLVTSSNPRKVMEAFVNLPQVQEVLARGETKSSVRH